LGIAFDPVNKYILITSPTTSLTALELYNASMDWCDELENMQYDPPMRALGKAPLGGGVYTDSIFILQNGWKIKPWSGTYQLVIEGTLITDDETQRIVQPDSGNVEAVFQVATYGTQTQSDVIDEMKNTIDLIYYESLGKLEITGNQLIIYKDDNVTEVARFNLYNAQGEPSMVDVVKRVRVS